MDDVKCPKCSGAMWDNRDTKKNPKAPDYKCRDKNCDGVIWPPRGQAAPRAASPQASPSVRGPKWTWAQLHNIYTRSVVIAKQELREVKGITAADMVAGAATIFIAATRDGVQEITVPEPAPADDGASAF